MITINGKSKSKPKLHCSHAQSLRLLLLCRRPSCTHMKKTKEKKISTVNWKEFSNRKRKEKFIIKICRLESECLFFITFYFSLCKSQEDCSSWFTKRKLKIQIEKCKHTKQAEFQMQQAPKLSNISQTIPLQLNQNMAAN